MCSELLEDSDNTLHGSEQDSEEEFDQAQHVEANSVRTDSGRPGSEELEQLESPPRVVIIVQFQDQDEDNLEGAQAN